MADILGKLYNQVFSKYDDFEDENDFRAFVNTATSGKIQRLYSTIQSEGYDDFADLDDFKKSIGWTDFDPSAGLNPEQMAAELKTQTPTPQAPAQTQASAQQAPASAQTPKAQPTVRPLQRTPTFAAQLDEEQLEAQAQEEYRAWMAMDPKERLAFLENKDKQSERSWLNASEKYMHWTRMSALHNQLMSRNAAYRAQMDAAQMDAAVDAARAGEAEDDRRLLGEVAQSVPDLTATELRALVNKLDPYETDPEKMNPESRRFAELCSSGAVPPDLARRVYALRRREIEQDRAQRAGESENWREDLAMRSQRMLDGFNTRMDANMEAMQQLDTRTTLGAMRPELGVAADGSFVSGWRRDQTRGANFGDALAYYQANTPEAKAVREIEGGNDGGEAMRGIVRELMGDAISDIMAEEARSLEMESKNIGDLLSEAFFVGAEKEFQVASMVPGVRSQMAVNRKQNIEELTGRVLDKLPKEIVQTYMSKGMRDYIGLHPGASPMEIEQVMRQRGSELAEQVAKEVWEKATEDVRSAMGGWEAFYSVFMNTLLGSILHWSGFLGAVPDIDTIALQTHMAEWEQEHPVLGTGTMIAGMGIDPFTHLTAGGSAAVTNRVMSWAGKRYLTATLGRSVSNEMAAQWLARNGAARVFSRSLNTGLNFGLYTEGMTSAQMAATGEWNMQDLLTKPLVEGAKGFAVGGVGGAIGNIFGKPASRAIESGNMKKAAAIRSAGTLVEWGTEWGVFAGASFLEGESWEDSWKNAARMVLGFKASNLAQGALGEGLASGRNIWEAKVKKTPGADQRPGMVDRVVQRLAGNPDLPLSSDDLKELAYYGYGDLRDIMHEVQTTKKIIRDGKEVDLGGVFYDNLAKLMEDGRVSAVTRAKMYQIITGDRLPMPTVRGGRVTEVNGRWVVESLDVDGGVVARKEYSSQDKADKAFEAVTLQGEANSVALGVELFQARNEMNAALSAARVLRMSDWGGVSGLSDRQVAEAYLNLKGQEGLTDAQHDFVERMDDLFGRMNNGFTAEDARSWAEAEAGVSVEDALGKSIGERTTEDWKAIEAYLSYLQGADEAIPEDYEPTSVERWRKGMVMAGMEATEAERRDMMLDYRLAVAEWESRYGKTDFDKLRSAIEDMEARGATDEEIAEARRLRDRIEKGALRVEGIHLGMERERDEAVRMAEEEYDKLVHEDGMTVRRGVLADGREVVIKSGSVDMREDGTVANGNDAVAWIDPETGEGGMTTAKAFGSARAEEAAPGREAARQGALDRTRQAQDAMSGREEIKAGAEVTVLNDEGQGVNVKVVSVEDGVALVEIDGEQLQWDAEALGLAAQEWRVAEFMARMGLSEKNYKTALDKVMRFADMAREAGDSRSTRDLVAWLCEASDDERRAYLQKFFVEWWTANSAVLDYKRASQARDMARDMEATMSDAEQYDARQTRQDAQDAPQASQAPVEQGEMGGGKASVEEGSLGAGGWGRIGGERVAISERITDGDEPGLVGKREVTYVDDFDREPEFLTDEELASRLEDFKPRERQEQRQESQVASGERQEPDVKAVEDARMDEQAQAEETVKDRESETERPADERQGDMLSGEGVKAPLSETDTDEFGKPFVETKDGSTVFGQIDENSGLAPAPIKLSLGENTVDGNGNNHGYGLLHIEAGHGDQIRSAGYKSVEEFVEDVARNYTDIREGAMVANHQTYLLEVSDDHNNTLFVQLSRNGKYWNVNSAGIFKKKYSRRMPKVYSVPALGEGKGTDTSEVDSGHVKGATAPAGNSSKTSGRKDSDSFGNKQEGVEKSLAEKQEEPDSGAMPMVEVKVKGKAKRTPDWVAAGAERSRQHLYNEKDLSKEEADSFVAGRIAASEKAVEDWEKKRPDASKYDDPDDYNEAKAAWEAEAKKKQAQLKLWQDVKATEERRVAEQTQAEAEARQRMSEPLEREEDQYRREMASAERDVDGPQDAYQYVMACLAGLGRRRGKGGDVRGTAVTYESLVKELGEGVAKEVRKRLKPGTIASRENGGVSIEQLADNIYEDMPEQFRVEVHDDPYYIRNMIIDALRSGDFGRAYAEQQESNKEAARSRIADEWDEYAQGKGHEDFDEYLAYERERIEDMVRLNRDYDEDAYNEWRMRLEDEAEKRNFADGKETTEDTEAHGAESDRLNTGKEYGETSDEPAGAGEGDGRGGGVLPPSGSADRAGMGAVEGRRPGAEAGDRLQGDAPQGVVGEERAGERGYADEQRGTAYDGENRELEDSPQVGPFGEIHKQFQGRSREAITFLLAKRSGEAIGALHHKDIGYIDLVWGEEGTGHSDGYGLAKLAKYHPEVLYNLQEILDDMIVTKRSDNRVQLESERYQASVRLSWDGQAKKWLLTVFEKKNSALDNTTDTVETLPSNGNDTATPENTVVPSGRKDSNSFGNKQEGAAESLVGRDGESPREAYDRRVAEVMSAQKDAHDLAIGKLGKAKEDFDSAMYEWHRKALKLPDAATKQDVLDAVRAMPQAEQQSLTEKWRRSKAYKDRSEDVRDAEHLVRMNEPEPEKDIRLEISSEEFPDHDFYGKDYPAQKMEGAPRRATEAQRRVAQAITDVMRKAGITVKGRKEMAEVMADMTEPVQRQAHVEATSQRYQEQLSLFAEGKMASNEAFSLGSPSAILLAAGIPAKEIVMNQGVLRRHLEKHGLAVDDVHGLVEAIQKPLMVYEWGSKSPSHVVITDLTLKDGRKVAIALRMDTEGNVHEVNEVASVHGKSVERMLEDMLLREKDFAGNKLKYVDKEKALAWLTQPSPREGSSSKQGLDVAKVIKDFENPKINPAILEQMTVGDGSAGMKPGRTEFLKTRDGEVYGFVKDGEVYIDETVMDPEVPLHEYTHLWDRAVRKSNPELWQRGKELMRELPLWDEVVNDPAYADIAHDEDLVASEVHSRLTGKDGAKRLDEMVAEAERQGDVIAQAKAITLRERVRQWLKDLYGWVRSAFGGKWGKKALDSLTLEEWNAMPLKDLAEGVRVKSEERKEKSSGDGNMTERMILGERGAMSLDSREEATTRMESRNVQSRLTMSEEKRSEKLLSETEDVARKDQIFLRNSLDEPQMASTEKKTASDGEKREKIANFAPEEIVDRIGASFWEGTGTDDRVAVVRHLQETEAGREVIERLNRHNGTPWAKAAVNSVLTRMALEDMLAGHEPRVRSFLTAEDSSGKTHGVVRLIQRHGQEGVWLYLVDKGVIGNAAKCVNNVNGSYASCSPSDNCAEFCYASKGNSASRNSIVKNELVYWAVRTDPKRVADMIARQYMTKWENADGKALRLFEAGDLDEAWLPVIEDLNRRGIVTQIFSKNPKVLERVDREKNVVMMSVDASNLRLLDENPDLPIAFVYASEADLPALEQCRERFERNGGVILPVVEGNKVLSQDDLKKLPQWTHPYQCPIDNGKRKINDKQRPERSWNCTKCDAKGGVGCFFHRTAKQLKEKGNDIRRDDISRSNEGLRLGAPTRNAEGILGGDDPLSNTIDGREEGGVGGSLLRALRLGGVPDAYITPELLETLDRWSRGRMGSRGSETNIEEIPRTGVESAGVSGRADGTGDRPEPTGGVEEVRYRLGDPAETFEDRRKAAVDSRGTVMPGLADAEVKVVDVPMHGYKGDKILDQAKAAAVERYNTKVRTGKNGKPIWEPRSLKYSNNGVEFEYAVSASAINDINHHVTEALAPVHAAVLDTLDKVIGNSIEFEEHPDVTKVEGKRTWGNPVNDNVLMHRFVGAVEVDGKTYRVITLMKEYKDTNRSTRPYEYELTNIKVLDDNASSTLDGGKGGRQASYYAAKLLNDVDKTYDPGKKIIEESEKVDTEARSRLREGDGQAADADARQAAVDAATETARGLNTQVKVVKAGDIEGANDAETEKMRNAKGWYDTRTGEVYIVEDNITSVDDAVTTVLHETVAHKGLRRLYGDRFDTVLDSVYESLPQEARDQIDRKTGQTLKDRMFDGKRPSYDEARREAVEEYLASLAEETNFEAMSRKPWFERTWERLKGWVTDLLLGHGIRLPRRLTDNELRYMLWRSRNNLERTRDMRVEAENRLKMDELGIGDRRYRDPDGIMPPASIGLTARRVRMLLEANANYEQGKREGALTQVTGAIVKLVKDMRGRKGTDKQWAATEAKSGRQADKAAKAQRLYDKAVVKEITDIAGVLIEQGYIDPTNGEVKRLLTIARDATGAEDVSAAADKIVDIMVDTQLRKSKEALDGVLKLRGSKVDAKGVEVQADLDPEGAAVMRAMREGLSHKAEELSGYSRDGEHVDGLLEKAREKAVSSDDETVRREAALAARGYELALLYHDSVGRSREDERAMREAVKDAEADMRAKIAADPGNAKAYRQSHAEEVAAIEEAIRQNRLERISLYDDFLNSVSGEKGRSVAAAEAWQREQEARADEIRHMANSDMAGKTSRLHLGDRSKAAKRADGAVNAAARTILNPLATFEQVLKGVCGDRAADGEGKLYRYFVYGQSRARDKEIAGYRSKEKEINDKIRQIMQGGGKSVMMPKGVRTIMGLVRWARTLPKMEVEYWDAGAKAMRKSKLGQGNLLYIYMVDKMPDGRMKLRKMGIGEEAVAAIEKHLDPRLRQFADWAQDEFLVKCRNEYNETHKRMFGASMAGIEDYFPLKILGESVKSDVDIDAQDSVDTGAATITGALKKRRVNTKPLDIHGSDALLVLMDHITEMEHWNAYCELGRDMNTLLSYDRFRRQVKGMRTVYGAGDELWNRLKTTARIAFGTYDAPVSGLNKGAVAMARNVTMAKVAFRANTAMKQLLSMPAMFPDLSVTAVRQYMREPGLPLTWALENLPQIKERWQGRMSGDVRLLKSREGWQDWRGNAFEWMQRGGMTPNAAVDLMTCSIVAYTAYLNKKGQLLKEGYSAEAAERRAKDYASVQFNLSQQSSEKMYVSEMQTNKDWLSTMLTIYRNASMSYTRQVWDGARNLAKYAHFGELADYQAKLILEDWERGEMSQEVAMLNDAEREKLAKRLGRKRARREGWRQLVKLATYHLVLPGLWTLGGCWLYQSFGSDEEEKEKQREDILTRMIYSPIEGVAGGDALSNYLTAGLLDGDWLHLKTLIKKMPIEQDAQNINDSKVLVGLNDLVNLGLQVATGANPQTFEDMVLAFIDHSGGDLETANEGVMLAARILNCPQSQIDKLYFDELGLTGEEASKLGPEQIVERYARYKVMRSAFWFTDWDEPDTELMDKYLKLGRRKAKERMREVDTEEYTTLFDRWQEKRDVLDRAKRNDRQAYAALLEEYEEKDPTGLETYHVLENLKVNSWLNNMAKARLGAQTGEERRRVESAMSEIKELMLELDEAVRRGATDEEKSEISDRMGEVMAMARDNN